MADHQVAHVYVNNPAIIAEVRAALEVVPGVESVIDGVWKASIGLDHARSGDLICLADKDSWFTYYYWHDDESAPDFAPARIGRRHDGGLAHRRVVGEHVLDLDREDVLAT